MRSLLLAVVFLTACPAEDDDPVVDPTPVDADSDGITADEDCDDDDADVYPGAPELCDGIDNDCNEVIDDAYASDAQVFFADADGDGYGDADADVMACEQPDNTVTNADDCDDSRSDVNPAADEVCNGRDDDCNRAIDDSAVDASVWYPDRDGDGYGRDRDGVRACEAPAEHVASDTDCNDNDPSINPETTWYPDEDGDGYGTDEGSQVTCAPGAGWALQGGDCDDTTPRANPGRDEVCDRIDNDCDGVADTTDGACEAWEGTWSGSYRANAQEKVGSSVINDMLCIGSAELVVDYAEVVPVVGTAGCTQTRYPGFYEGQEATLEGEIYPDGTFVGTIEHGFNSYSTRTYDLDGTLDGGLSLDAEGTMRPNSMSAVPWEVTLTIRPDSGR